MDEPQDPCSDLFRMRLAMLQHIKMYVFVLLHALTASATGALCLAALVLVNSISFVRTCLINPGAVAKKLQHKYLPDIVHLGPDATVQILVDNNGDWLRRIQIKDAVYEEKYCLECNLFRVQGMAHCRDCDRCILDMDHHCMWFGNCIGRNNIRHFHVYLYSVVPVILANIVFLDTLLERIQTDTWTATTFKCIVLGALGLYCVFFLLVFGFTLFHIYIALCSSRSRDFIRGRRGTPSLRTACTRLSTIRPDISFEHLSV